MPSLDDLYVQPVNSHSIVCDKTTVGCHPFLSTVFIVQVMVQRVHEFARRVNENLGSAVFGTPFAHPDRLTAAILGLSWRAVKRAVEVSYKSNKAFKIIVFRSHVWKQDLFLLAELNTDLRTGPFQRYILNGTKINIVSGKFTKRNFSRYQNRHYEGLLYSQSGNWDYSCLLLVDFLDHQPSNNRAHVCTIICLGLYSQSSHSICMCQ